ncbi:DUF1570 domain-containing protein [Anatilimnocola floriformis]|uniref:DUF1570 domain-containing protein n=1 Tax=Anatilimnocola floriformis TaxID=2948575 RepID=UPI0020C56A8E|nr:DUF1570 domain-containing protein [Anatilimnocola floriformis]
MDTAGLANAAGQSCARTAAWLGCLIALFGSSQVLAQPLTDSLGTWKLEELRTKEGKFFKGLVQDEREHDLDFAEIVQPMGKPMYAVLRWVRKREILTLTKLPDEEHEQLLKRFEQFRLRTVIEAGKMEDLLLRTEEHGAQTHHLYDGPWFRVDSTTDEETTRRCVVRIEQIFQAYRMILPPKGRPQELLRIRLYGSLDQYRDELRRLKLNISNPAFYSSRERTILAGTDLDTYSRHLTEIRHDHEQARKEWEQRDTEFHKHLPEEVAKLKAAGFTQNEINDEMNLRKARWREQLAAKYAQLVEIDRRNDGKFAEVTAQMFAQLYHEAFHAWLDNFVYAKSRKNVPRWLNEGLAQVFESGRLDGQSLRLDAPSPTRLATLQADLKREPWPLAELLNNENAPFLEGHARDSKAAERTYAYAWGLAWYLAFHEQKLSGAALDQFVAPAAAELSPIERFEKFTGKRLPDFEKEWRRAMLEARPPR